MSCHFSVKRYCSLVWRNLEIIGCNCLRENWRVSYADPRWEATDTSLVEFCSTIRLHFPVWRYCVLNS
ncbi:hypothetical protein V6N13_090776 [Hibiscus sabdariffa]